MHISNAQIQKVLELHLHKVYSTRRGQTTGAAASDELVLSPKAADMQQVKQKIIGLPDTRADIVREMKHKIEAGEYKVGSAELADGIISALSQGR